MKKFAVLLTPLALLLCPLAYFIKFFHVPLFTPDVVCLTGLTMLVALCFSALLWRAGWVRQTIVLTTVALIALSFFPALQAWLWFNAVLFATLVVVLLLDTHALQIFQLMGSVLLAGIILLPVGQQFSQTRIKTYSAVSANNQLPPIIHIILDEHMGLAALPPAAQGGEVLQNTLTQFYTRNGFRVYPNAYSHYVRTYDSIPNLLNFTEKAQDAYYFPKKNPTLSAKCGFSITIGDGV